MWVIMRCHVGKGLALVELSSESYTSEWAGEKRGEGLGSPTHEMRGRRWREEEGGQSSLALHSMECVERGRGRKRVARIVRLSSAWKAWKEGEGGGGVARIVRLSYAWNAREEEE